MLRRSMSRPPTDRALAAAFVLSGAAALGNEIVWTRLLSAALGHEMLGVLGVLGGFFGGMALGAAVLHGRMRRSPDPLGAFARLEIVVALFAVLAPLVLPPLADLLPVWLGPDAADRANPVAVFVHTAVAGAVLVPATFAMGATFPALVEARRRLVRDDDGRGVAFLYAANTLGAVVGVLATIHLLLPALGMWGGGLACAALGLAAAGIARNVARRTNVPATPSDDVPFDLNTAADPDPHVADETWVLYVVAFGTGALGVGLEVVLVDVLGQVFDGTIYTFAAVLAVYLAGTWAGSRAYAPLAARARNGRPATVLAALLVLLGLAVPLAAHAATFVPSVFEVWARTDANTWQRSAVEAACAAIVFALPTFLMGLSFAHLVGLVPHRGVGRIYAANTLGSAVAPFVFGLWAIDRFGYADALYAVAYGYGAVFLFFTYFRRFGIGAKIGGIALLFAATVVGPRSLVLVAPDPDWKELERRETAMGLVLVSEFAGQDAPRDPPLRRLQVGKRYRMGGALAFGERRMGHLPLLLHPAPAEVLYLGVGTGATMGAVTTYEGVSATGVELVPAVLEMLPYFAATNGGLAEDPDVRLVAADARRFVAGERRRFDVIVADLFHPERDGAGSLYAREHFEHVRDRLAEGGVFVQWLPLHQFAFEDLRIVTRTFLDVFGEAHGFLGIYNVETPALALAAGGIDLAPERIAARLASHPVYRELLMADVRDVLAARLLGPDALRTLAEGAPANTDRNQRITLLAPRRPRTIPRGPENVARLLALSEPPKPAEIHGDDAEAWAAEADRFARALRLYLRGELVRTAEPDADVPRAAVDAYLSAYEIAPEFRPARGMLLQASLRDPATADRVLPLMIERAPDDVELVRFYASLLARRGDTDAVRDLLGGAGAGQ
ncbi:MAG: hypothetical protein D6705_02520 [Deltaproteobacteria bacterium]|nr:MAG: hypothetical protein D6705_02520 [Deltaproteobacteria bacterium]